MAAKYHRKDRLHQKAKQEGYRSRAAYKLMELDDKYKLMRPGSKVLDLGAWPGGWLQVASARVGANGVVVGIDLNTIEDLHLSNVSLITGDLRDSESLSQIEKALGENADLVMSDMSPKLTGIADVDRAAASSLYELAFAVTSSLLRTGGNFIVKVFKSNEAEVFVKSLRPLFNKVLRTELDASRSTSQEYYVIGLGFVRQPRDS